MGIWTLRRLFSPDLTGQSTRGCTTDGSQGISGFLVLGLGVLGWPLLSWLFGITGWSILEDQLVSLAIRAGLTVGEVVVVVAMASRLAQGGMILIGILLIGRAQNGRTSDVAHRPAEA
jgi:hypothetical protein